MSYIQHVPPLELERATEDVKTLLAELTPGYRLLVDLSRLESMELESMNIVGRMMELFDQSGVGMIVRVIPDPSKDIGFNIYTIFHYPHRPKVITCETMPQAARALAL